MDQCFKMILNIPEELLLKIFSYLTTQDLLQNVALVNRTFKKVAMDADLLKIIVLKDIDEHVYQEAENVLAKARRLQKLTLKLNVLNPERLVKVAFATSKGLKSLDIIGHFTSDLALSLRENGQQLEHLDFSKMRTTIELDTLLNMTHLRNLKVLKCVYRWPFQYKDIIIRSLTLNCQQLEEVEFPDISFVTNEILEEFCMGLKNSLRKLSIHCLSVLQWTFQSLSIMERLTILDIHAAFNLTFTEDQIRNLANIPLLKEFSLRGQWFLSARS